MGLEWSRVHGTANWRGSADAMKTVAKLTDVPGVRARAIEGLGYQVSAHHGVRVEIIDDEAEPITGTGHHSIHDSLAEAQAAAEASLATSGEED